MAQALKFYAIISGNTLPLPDLSAFEGKRVEVVVIEDEPAAPRTRSFGTLAGQLTVAVDFDAPLPDQVLKDFEGEP